MPAIVTATIVQWEVVERARRGDNDHCTPCVCFRSCEMGCFFVPDGATGSDLSPIIAQYISRRERASPGVSARLLQDAANGLLQVIVHHRAAITPPPVPIWCDELQPPRSPP